MKHFIGLIYFFSTSILFPIVPSADEFKKIVLWKGELTGIFKNKVRIKVEIPPHSSLATNNSKNIQKELLEIKEYELIQKDTEKIIGKFFPENIRIDKHKAKKGTRLSVELYGKFILEEPKNLKLLSIDFYIASFKLEKKYIDPLGYGVRPSPPAQSFIHPIDKKEMVFIPSGFFLHGQGSDAGKDNFNPNFFHPTKESLMETSSYYIDKYEVTNREYYKFLKNTNTTPPPHWENGIYPDGEDNYPVNFLTYQEVEKYAKWTGKRIPTEFEWEKAARGQGLDIKINLDESITITTFPLTYPFGQNFDPELCNSKEVNLGKTFSIYELAEKGASPYGAIGMCGNAAEWTSSWYLPYPGNFKKNISYGKQFKVIRGGSFFETKKEGRTFYRMYGGLPSLHEDRRAGFRLVLDIKN